MTEDNCKVNAPNPGLGPPLVEGLWAGWSLWTTSEPFEDSVGPFYAKREPDGSMTCGFRPGAQSLNSAGVVHGGALATFADYSLFTIAADRLLGTSAVTVSLNAEFVGSARAGDLLTARGEVLRAGRSLVFVRGVIYAAGGPVLSFAGVLKILHRKS